jgi:phage head maturation protease
MNKPLHVTIPIAKIDEDQRMVYGYATVEEIDAHGEIIGYDASKKAFGAWIGNIRDMHQDIAVGKNMETEFDDEAKGVWIGAKISESDDGEQAWIKVKEGVYSGFSIGGKINDAEVRTMSVDGKKKSVTVITDYDLGEVSLVDNPACPSAIFQMVKSVDGKLEQTEEIQKGLGRPVHWWEKQFKFSDSQNIMKADFMTYNENSMSDKKTTLAKSLWEADMLVDLAECLADFIYWKSYEGEDNAELKAALESIKQAAIAELEEPENFPEVVSVAIENACRALNISKKEELVTMITDRKEAKKSIVKTGSNVVDGDARDTNAASVTEVVAGTAPVKPAAIAVPKKVYAKDGVTTTQKSADLPVNDTEEAAAEAGVPVAGAEVEVEQDVLGEDGQPTGEKETVTVTQPLVNADGEELAEVDENGDPVEAPAAEEPETPEAEEEEPEAPAADPTSGEDDKPKKFAPVSTLKKSTGNDDLAKMVSAAVAEGIAKAVAPLEEQIAELKKQPAASKVRKTYTVKKGEAVDGSQSEDDSAEGKLKAEFDQLNKRADELAASPDAGTHDERLQVAFKLRKLSRQLDPASVAQNAAVRATFNRGQ